MFRRPSWVVTQILLLVVVSFGQQANRRFGQYSAQAQRSLSLPFKVEVRSETSTANSGTSVPIFVELKNADGRLMPSPKSTRLLVRAVSPSGAEQNQVIDIPAGTASAKLNITLKEAGVSKLEVREANDALVAGSNFLLVMDPKKTQKPSKKSVPLHKSTVSKTKTLSHSLSFTSLANARLVDATYAFQGPTGEDTSPKILLSVGGEGDGRVRADGITKAEVSVFLVSSEAASRDINIWLEVDRGRLAERELTIRRGTFAASTAWTATDPGAAKVRIKEVVPHIRAETSAAEIEFIEPIVAIVFANPINEMSIVEQGTMTVRFVDRDGNPVQTRSARPFHFIVNSGKVAFKPEKSDTKAGDPDFGTAIVPLSIGEMDIEASVPGFRTNPPQKIKVTGLSVLLICLLGGGLGALVNHLDRKQQGLWASLLIGLIVSIPFTMLYIWIGLPHLDSAYLHSSMGAFVIAVIGGIAGATGLKGAAKMAGWSLFGDSAKAMAAGGGR